MRPGSALNADTYVSALRADGDEQERLSGAAGRDGGDSGSLIVDDGLLGIGLLFAGGDQGGTNGLRYGLKVNIAETPPLSVQFPDTIAGVPIRIEVTGVAKARRS